MKSQANYGSSFGTPSVMMQTAFMRTHQCGHVRKVSQAALEPLAAARWGDASKLTLQPAGVRARPTLYDAGLLPRCVPEELAHKVLGFVPDVDLIDAAERASISPLPSERLFARALFAEGVRRIEAVQGRVTPPQVSFVPPACATQALNYANAWLMVAREQELRLPPNAFGTLCVDVIYEKDASKESVALSALTSLATYRSGVPSFFALAALARSLAVLGEKDVARLAARSFVAMAKAPELAPFATDVLTELLNEEDFLVSESRLLAAEVAMLLRDATLFSSVCTPSEQASCNVADAMSDWWENKFRFAPKDDAMREVLAAHSARLDCGS